MSGWQEFSRARNSTRRILPEIVFGSHQRAVAEHRLSMNSMRRMRW
jgi:hypothetical protein